MLRRSATHKQAFRKTRGERRAVLLNGRVRRLWFGFALLSLLGGCGTKAVGVAECRDIEQARCTAASSCGFPNVAECRTFYRDHCLHGLPIGTFNDVDVEACVTDIEHAGQCAGRQGPTTAPEDCSTPVATSTGTTTICEVVLKPETAVACAFLVPPPVSATPSAPATDAGGT
jgi:hypothetical protein